MKRFMPFVIWFVAGAALSQLAGTVIFRLWEKLGILMPVAHWLGSHVGEAMAKAWFVLYVFMPTWIVAAVVGILAGLFIKRHLVPYLLVCGIGFVLGPLVAYWYLHSGTPFLSSVVWYAVSIPVLVFCGIVCHRRNSPPNTSLEPTATALADSRMK